MDVDGNGQENCWNKEEMETTKDFVVWYAYLDTKPLAEAVQTTFVISKSKGTSSCS